MPLSQGMASMWLETHLAGRKQKRDVSEGETSAKAHDCRGCVDRRLGSLTARAALVIHVSFLFAVEIHNL